MTTDPAGAPRRAVVIHNVPWETYETILAAFDGRNNARFAFDAGALEVMAPLELGGHSDCAFLAGMVKELAPAFGLPVRGGGSTTLKRRDAAKGIDPDSCLWLANAPRLAGVRRLDLTIHPPPDLALEIDGPPDSLDKFAIYSAIGVPELWRLDGDDLRFYRLGPDAAYAAVTAGGAFPGIAPADLLRFLADARGAVDQGAVTRAFRAWLAARGTPGA